MPMKYPHARDRVIANSVPAPDSAYDGTLCWLWIGANNGRYGKVGTRYAKGKRKGEQRTLLAHRYAVMAWGRQLWPRQVVLHLCNNPLCVNPAHLTGGTQRKNIRQCVSEGRHKTPFRKA